jgi:hypothetical protein
MLSTFFSADLGLNEDVVEVSVLDDARAASHVTSLSAPAFATPVSRRDLKVA